jgi:hypothetical protein
MVEIVLDLCSADLETECLFYSTIFAAIRDKYRELLGRAKRGDKHLKERLIEMTDAVVSIVRREVEDDRHKVIAMKRVDSALPWRQVGAITLSGYRVRDRVQEMLQEARWRVNAREHRKLILWNVPMRSMDEFEQALKMDVGVELQEVEYCKYIHSHPAQYPRFEMGFKSTEAARETMWAIKHRAKACGWSIHLGRPFFQRAIDRNRNARDSSSPTKVHGGPGPRGPRLHNEQAAISCHNQFSPLAELGDEEEGRGAATMAHASTRIWLTMLTWNANGLRTRWLELQAMVQAQRPELVAHQERVHDGGRA